MSYYEYGGNQVARQAQQRQWDGQGQVQGQQSSYGGYGPSDNDDYHQQQQQHRQQYAQNDHHQQPPYASQPHAVNQQYQQQQPHRRGDYQRGGQQQQEQHQQPYPDIMAGGYQNQAPKLGATFYPGGQDDFYMPDLISPTPQRVMPEVPSNMQEGLAHLELEAREAREAREGHRASSQSTVSSMTSPRLDPQLQGPNSRGTSQNYSQRTSGPGFTASYQNTNASAYQNLNRDQYGGSRRDQDAPVFSPFPKPKDSGPNVPMSDEDKEEVLERARPLVLQSSDPEMQLAWAQDALSWVEVASQYYARQQGEGLTRAATPKVEHQLREDALSIVKFLADQGHPKAEFMRGMWLEFGKFGVRMDKKEAFMAYRRAAEKGYARAEYRIGMQYEGSNNSAKALEHYKKGVALEDSASKYRLGMMLLLGQHGMHQDQEEGVRHIREAAETADENAPQGAYVYGMLLAHELDRVTVPEQVLEYNPKDAKLFIEKAAYLGFAKAQLKMAQAYELCQLGCEFEPALSLHYNALAARQGEAEADMAISKWFLCGYQGVFEKNEELAFTYAKRAAQSKMATAEFAMGYFYEIGIYVPVDLHESEIWYQKAMDHGNKDALGRIDSIRKNNTLKKEDHEKMAISRIKSQHGSQRGGRPDRFKQKSAPMPTMGEEIVDMPDPRNSYARPQSSRPLPPRPVSTAPYPEDDMVPHLGQAPPQGQAPQASYGQGLRPHSTAGPHADRPSSAFGIRAPLSHSSSESHGHRDSLPSPNDPLRPSTSMGSIPVPSTRISHSAMGGRPTPPGWEPQVPPKYREPSPSKVPTIPQIDNGRPMNFNQGANGFQKQLPLNVNKPHPQPPQPSSSQGYGTNQGSQPQPGFKQQIQRRDPAANQFIRPERGSSMTPVAPSSVQSGTPQLNQRPERIESMHGQIQNPNRASQRPTTTMSSQTADSRQSSIATSINSGHGAPPKKTGPATFEEMGIPAGKNESDCVVM